jgi:ketosteroid isomerase-like protein
MNKGDVERELTYLHPNVVVTWHDAEVSRGRDGVRKYLQRMMGGPHPIVSSFHADVDVDELSILYAHDEVAISWGSARETFKMADGRSLVLPARWSATLVKGGGRWQIASLHASDDLFDNPILTLAKRAAYWAAGIALLIGVVLGWLLGRRRRPA